MLWESFLQLSVKKMEEKNAAFLLEAKSKMNPEEHFVIY